MELAVEVLFLILPKKYSKIIEGKEEEMLDGYGFTSLLVCGFQHSSWHRVTTIKDEEVQQTKCSREGRYQRLCCSLVDFKNTLIYY